MKPESWVNHGIYLGDLAALAHQCQPRIRGQLQFAGLLDFKAGHGRMGEDGKADIIPLNHWLMVGMRGWEHGFREYTIMSQVSQPPGYQNSVANVRYDITSAEIKGNTLTFVKVFTAYAGSGESAKEVEGKTFPVVFDPKTCSGYFGDKANPIYFVVGDSGHVIKSLKGTTPLSSTISASLGDFIRQ